MFKVSSKHQAREEENNMPSIASHLAEVFKPVATLEQTHEQPHTQAASDGTQKLVELPPTLALRRLPDPPLRILLVDDSADSRFLVCAWLKKLRCIVLMDLQMPFMDGYEACRRIRAWERQFHRPPTPIIALTAFAFDDEVQHAYEAGCDAHVAKPVRKETLLAAIWAATNNDAAEDEFRAALYAAETAMTDDAIWELGDDER
jgi:Response regulator receiver domain